MGSETLPSACNILSDKSSIPFYSTINGYNDSAQFLQASNVISLIPYRITGVTADRTGVLLGVCPNGACDAPWLNCPGLDWDPANILVCCWMSGSRVTS